MGHANGPGKNVQYEMLTIHTVYVAIRPPKDSLISEEEEEEQEPADSGGKQGVRHVAEGLESHLLTADVALLSSNLRSNADATLAGTEKNIQEHSTTTPLGVASQMLMITLSSGAAATLEQGCQLG